MKKNFVPMRFAGMDFLLDMDFNMAGEYEGLLGVQIWSKENRSLYHDVNLNIEEFEKALKDQIYEAIEEWKRDNKLAAEDLAYDTAKEEGLI